MADDLIELAFEGVDRVSDPDFIYHRKRKEKRLRKLEEQGGSQSLQSGELDPGNEGSSRREKRSIQNPSASDPFDNDSRGRAIYPDARNPNYTSRGASSYAGSEDPSRGRRGKDDDYRRSRRDDGRRPDLRSRSSHQGNHSVYPDEYEYADGMPSRRSRSQRGRSMKNKSANQSPQSGFDKAGEYFSDTKAGLGATAIGTLAGGYVAYRAAKSKEKSGEQSDPYLFSILGAMAGGFSANVIEKYVEHGKDDGRVRDKWGEEVGTSRKQMKEKMRSMTRGDRREEDRRDAKSKRRDRYADDDDY